MQVWILCRADYYDSYSTAGVTNNPDVVAWWEAKGTGYWTDEHALDVMSDHEFRGSAWEPK